VVIVIAGGLVIVRHHDAAKTVPRRITMTGNATRRMVVIALALAACPALAADLPPDLATTLAAFDRAQFSNDVPTLTGLYADDYVLVNSDASVENKQQALADYLAPGFKAEPYVLEEPVRLLSTDTAVVAGLARLRWTQDGEHHTRTVRMAYVWMKRAGRWQASYTQVTRVPS
jgi:ketosteroid isomerase-like protein